MSQMTPDEIRRSLRAQDVPEHLIEKYQRDQSTAARPLYPPKPEPIDRPAITWPVTLLLPWSYLISDNERHGVINGKLLLTVAYRRAKGLTRELARARLGNVEPASYPVRLEARVWVPDEIRAHDVPNFGKCVHDALETVVYVKDRWLWKASWERAGVDVDAPRCELVIRPWMATAEPDSDSGLRPRFRALDGAARDSITPHDSPPPRAA